MKISKTYQAYLFDLDGTLIDTMPMIIACYRHVTEYVQQQYHAAICLSDEVIIRNTGLPLRPSLQLYYGQITNVDLERLREEYTSYQTEVWKDYLSAYDGANECLAALRSAGKKIAIVTSRGEQYTKLYCAHVGFDKNIEHYITPESVSNPKPHPEAALKAAELLQTATADCLFIGDSSYDIDCACGAGMDSALVPWGAANSVAQSDNQPTYKISSYQDLYCVD